MSHESDFGGQEVEAKSPKNSSLKKGENTKLVGDWNPGWEVDPNYRDAPYFELPPLRITYGWRNGLPKNKT